MKIDFIFFCNSHSTKDLEANKGDSITSSKVEFQTVICFNFSTTKALYLNWAIEKKRSIQQKKIDRIGPIHAGRQMGYPDGCQKGKIIEAI